MKKILLSFSVLALIIVFGACKKSNNAPPTTASVMFVHGCAAGATTINVDAIANNTTVASNIAFLSKAGYLQVSAGSGVNLSFKVTGLNTLISSSENLTAGTSYSVFAGGAITTPSFVFTQDDLSAPTAGNAKVRFVNLSPDGLNTSCYVGTSKIDSNVGYKTCTPFFEVPATTAKIEMVDQTVLINSGDIASQQLVAGKIYTFMLTGTATGSGTSVLTLTVINNNN